MNGRGHLNTLARLEKIAETVIGIVGDDPDAMRLRNSRKVKKAAASILEAIATERQETAARVLAERAEEEARRAAAIAEVEALAESLGLQVRVTLPAAPAKLSARVGPIDVGGATPKQIRTWALDHGMAVGPRGIIPNEVKQAYALAHAS